MRKLMIGLLLPVSLVMSGCAGFSLPTTPSDAANGTILDERAALSVELAYKAQAKLLETAVDAGLLKGNRAAVAATFDIRAKSAVDAVRAAYDAGNAQSYNAAIDEARSAIEAAVNTISGENA